jgi:hypothetical protein
MKKMLVVVLFAASLLHGQNSAKAEAAAHEQKKTLTDAASAGAPLPATINVADNVNIEAVMLPREISRRVFGKHVADNYAVIEVNISNRSKDAALILQSLFIDLSNWGLAGPLSSGVGAAGLTRTSQAPPFQAQSSASQVASVEYRIVRGQLQDAQPWTTRNVALRAIQVLGTIGTAFAFPFTADVVKGVGAWNGAVVPGFQTMFPDGMEGQLNRISDYGFRNNKIIPQESADIVVAFFPIERFLSPSLSAVFLNSPSLFFNPLLMAVDPVTRKLLRPILLNVYSTDDNVKKASDQLLAAIAGAETARAVVEQDSSAIQAKQLALAEAGAAITSDEAKGNAGDLATDKALRDSDEATLGSLREQLAKDTDTLAGKTRDLKSISLFGVLSTYSLNNVHITVSGVMTVDESAVPPTIEATCFDKPSADLWTVAGDKTCSITGKFLSNGDPKIADAAKLGISDIAVVSKSSTDQLLTFTYKLKAPLDSPVTFDLIVSKPGKDGKTVESMKYHVSSAYTLEAPTITSVTQKDKTVSVAGTGFYSTPKNAFKAMVRPIAAKDDKSDVPVKTTAAESSTAFTLDTSKFDSTKVAPGCYFVVAMVGTLPSEASKDKLKIDAAPKITAATLLSGGKSVQVTGEQLVDTKDCGGTELEFELLDKNGKVLGTVPSSAAKGDAGKLTFDFPGGVSDKNAASVRIKGTTTAVPIKAQ